MHGLCYPLYKSLWSELISLILNTIHWIVILPGGLCYPMFEQPGPGGEQHPTFEQLGQGG